MYLIQLLIPLTDNRGKRFPEALYATLADELTDRFGGVTAYTRSPAIGLWSPDGEGRHTRDDIVAYEVLAEDLDRNWWRAYRQCLEERFRQDEIIARAHVVERI